MVQPLFDHLNELQTRVSEAERILLFLDFDGTLAPIAKTPGQAAMSRETGQVLADLAARKTFVVVIVSGRAIADLRPKANIPALIYAGNHGLEISGAGLEFAEPEAMERKPALEDLLREMAAELHLLPGVEIESKELSASIHFRQAPEAHEDVRRIVESRISGSKLFCVREGKMIYEILPCVPWRKDAAVNWIRKMPGFERGLAICIGDDATDEDLFAAGADGITVRVGEAAKTAAQYFVTDTDDVRSFLVWLGAHAPEKQWQNGQ